MCVLLLYPKQQSLSFHPPPSFPPPSLERHFPEPRPGKFASVRLRGRGDCEKERGAEGSIQEL